MHVLPPDAAALQLLKGRGPQCCTWHALACLSASSVVHKRREPMPREATQAGLGAWFSFGAESDLCDMSLLFISWACHLPTTWE